MEFEDLGKHCAFCNQKDILPMQCGSCHQYFCLEHIQREQHKCEKMNSNEKMVIVCKKCDQLIQLIPGVDPKILVDFNILILLFATLIYMGYSLSKSCKDLFASYLSFGFTSLLIV